MDGQRGLGGPGYDVVEKVLGTIDRYDLVAPGATVLVGVSGGPDSTCLLDVLERISAKLDLALVIAHVDHGLRDDSEDIAARVARVAAEHGRDVHVMRIADLAGPNLQAKARELRYRFFDKVAVDAGASRIATGHTLDDRAETTVARLIHGAATGGLAGLRPGGRRIRPLIELRRSETRSYCDEVGLYYDDDPANLDERFERVAVRRMVGAIEERFGDGAVRAIARSAARLAEDDDALDAQADLIYEGAAGSGERFDLDTMLGLPRALRRRVLELMVGTVRDRAGGIDAALDALERTRGRDLTFAVAQGIRIAITSDEVRVTREVPD